MKKKNEFFNKFMNFFTTGILALVCFYALLIIIVFFFQRNLLYHPSIDNYLKNNEGNNEPTQIEKVKILTKDKINLNSWFYYNTKKNSKTILFLHGNAGSLENRTYKLNHFKNLNLNFLIIAWRGFSGNSGKPNEKGLYEDAKSATNWLKGRGIHEKDIILYGESLGTGVAIEIAQNKNYGGIILESPFTSMVNMGKKYYPFFPVKFLLKDKYESNKKIDKINIPIFIIHGKVDKIVPYKMGKKMYELANEPKYFYSQQYGDHMVEYDEKLLIALKRFVESLN